MDAMENPTGFDAISTMKTLTVLEHTQSLIHFRTMRLRAGLGRR
jgi:hypothetical protein